MAPETEDTANFWHNADDGRDYWEQYLAARPKYDTCNFYDKAFAYHDAHSASYDTAHDVATGPGQVARVLATRFQHVVASDLNETHLQVSKRFTADLAPKITILLSSAEDLATNASPASADAIFVAEALGLMDTEAALASFHAVLKKNGTLASWFYGRPMFADGEKEACQVLYDKIITKLTGAVIKSSGPQSRAGWKRGTDMLASWLDNVAFPAGAWMDVQRHKWNAHGKMVFFEEEACDFPIEVASEITEAELVTETVDEDLWAEKWDLGDVRRFAEAQIPSIFALADVDPEIEAWYGELGVAMGGKGVRRKISWPVVLLLATKR